MSAHICEQITYDRIGSFIDTYYYKHFRERLQRFYSEDSSQKGMIVKLINDMFHENIRSVNTRYRDNTPYTLIPYNRVEVDVVQFMKSIAYWRYQSCETPDWDTSKIYQFATDLRVSAIDLVDGYEQAEWG